jgi:uncharacterized membrane protein YbjE (DUF340 family)
MGKPLKFGWRDYSNRLKALYVAQVIMLCICVALFILFYKTFFIEVELLFAVLVTFQIIPVIWLRREWRQWAEKTGQEIPKRLFYFSAKRVLMVIVVVIAGFILGFLLALRII